MSLPDNVDAPGVGRGVVDGQIDDQAVGAHEPAERIAADERPAVDRLWIGLADPTHASDEGGRLRPGDTLVRRSNHLDIVALPELAVLVAQARLDVEEAVDKCAVGQND